MGKESSWARRFRIELTVQQIQEHKMVLITMEGKPPGLVETGDRQYYYPTLLLSIRHFFNSPVNR